MAATHDGLKLNDGGVLGFGRESQRGADVMEGGEEFSEGLQKLFQDMEVGFQGEEADGDGRVGAIEALRNWVISQGRSEATAARVVGLLRAENLEREPRPRAWNRRGDFTGDERSRYLWYRHTARLLGWRDRGVFPDFVTKLLRDCIFPGHGAHQGDVHETAREGRATSVPGVDGGRDVGAPSSRAGEGNARDDGREALHGSGKNSDANSVFRSIHCSQGGIF